MQLVKKYWDIITLGKTKWIIFSIYFLGWIVSKTINIMIDTSQFTTHQFAYMWNLSVITGKYPIILYWNYLWIDSLIYKQTSFIMFAVLFLIFTVAYLRGQ